MAEYKVLLGADLRVSDIRKRISEYNSNSNNAKLKLGIKLDPKGISGQIKAINSKTPVKINVQLNPSSVQKIQNQINNIRTQIQQLGNIRINLGGNTGGGSRSSSQRAVNDMNWAYRQMLDIQRKANSIQIRMTGLDTSKNVNELKELSAQFDRLKADYNTLKGLFGSQLSTVQWGNLQAEVTETDAKLSALNAKFTDTKAKLASGIQANFGNYDAQLLSLEGKFKRLSVQPEGLRIGVEKVRQALSTLKSADSTEAIITANENYKRVLKEVEGQLRINAEAERQANANAGLAQQRQTLSLQMNKWLRDNSAAASQFGGKIKELQAALVNCDSTTLNRLRSEFTNIKLQADMAGKSTQTFGDRLRTQFARYSSYFSVMSLFMYGAMALRSMFTQVKAIDTAMTELKKVTNETEASYNQFLTDAASNAERLGTTIDGLVKSTAGFARLGYGFGESQKLAEVANIYAVVGDEVDGVDGATKSLISTMAAFRDETGKISNEDMAMSIIDKFNEVGNNFAISSGGIGEAMQRSASSLMSANNTLDESIALITAANTVVQDPVVIGTSFKTISMRIRGAKTELEEAGLETEGMVESTAKLREEILALSGVDIMENDNTFKSTYAIMDELAKKWKDLTDIQQASVIELIAGKRQGNVVSSLMTNFDIAREALETSLNSEGSAMTEHEKWMQSIEAGINRIKAAWQGLSQNFLKSDFLKGLLKGVANLTSGFSKLVDTFGTLPTLFAAFAGFRALFNKGGFFKVATDELTGFATGITTTFGQVAKSVNASLNTISVKKGFRASLSKDDIGVLRDYGNALNRGVSQTTAWNKCMTNASETAQQAAKSNEFLTGGLKGYISSQQEANVSTLAQSKSLGAASALMKEYHNGCKTTGMSQQSFANAVKQTNPQLAAAMTSTNNAKSGMIKYTASLIGAKAATLAMQVAVMALNAALSMGIGLLVSAVFSGISKLINRSKELAERVEELTSKFKEQHKELKKINGDYDTTNEDSMISKYEKLSRGVNHLGENVSLTAEEYSEYQGIVNKIAEQIPSLVAGYDEQGNALLNVKGNVEDLVSAYEDLIRATNNEVIIKANDVENDFENSVKKSKKTKEGFWNWFIANDTKLSSDGLKKWEDLLNKETISAEEIERKFSSFSDVGEIDAMYSVLKDANADIIQRYTGSGYESKEDVIARIYNKNRGTIKSIIDNYHKDLETETEGMKSLAEAVLSNALDISDSEYYGMSDTMKSIAKQIVDGFDFEFFAELQEDGTSIDAYVNSMLDQLNAISSEDNTKIEAAFDLQTQFNGGEISYGEYIDGVQNTGELIKGLGLDKKVESELLLSLGLNEDGLVEEYKQLRSRLADEELFNIMPEDYEPFLKGLSVEELSVLVDIIPELSESEYKETIEDVKSILRREMIVQGLTFDLNLEVESAGIEALNTALAESVSATGLSSDSISALKGRYSELESQGYDLASMFEETSNGIHINRTELGKLEKAYASQKLDEVKSDLTEMKSEYDRIGEELKTCSNEAKAGLYNDQLTLAQKISEAATLASQYEGLTSAYNDWLAAEEAGQERDMYENIISGFETIDDEIARGWMDDAAIEFLEMLTGKTDLVGKSGKELKEIYNSLGTSIKYVNEEGKVLENTGYKIRDFFTIDEDGNATSKGVYNFLDAIGKLEEEAFGKKDIVQRKDGKIIGFNFELVAQKDEKGNIIKNGDQVVAEALGISEELVQIMKRAADDAGFIVSLDGTYKQLADLQNEARTAADYLKSIGITDFEFDFNTSNVESLNTQLNEAHKILDNKDFWKDGVFDDTVDGAKQAMEVVSTLQAKLDYLTQEKYGIGLTVEDEEFEEPLTNLQEYGRTIQTLNQLKLNPKVNAEEIEICESRLDELAQEFNKLDKEKKLEIGLEIEKGVALTQENLDKLTDEKKIKLGFVGDDGKPLTNVVDVIQNKIESGEVTIPTVLDIQANMDKNIEKLADLAWLNSGFLTDDEEEVLRKKYNIEIEVDEVDTSDVDEKVEGVIKRSHGGIGGGVSLPSSHGGGGVSLPSSHGGGGVSLPSSREVNVEIIAKTFGIDDVDNLSSKLEGLDDKTVSAVAKAIGKIQVDELKQAVALLEPNEVEAIAKAIGKGDVVELSDIIGQLSSKTVDAIANALGYDDVNDLRIAVENLDPKTVEAVANALGITDVESLKGAIDNLQPKSVEVEATTSGESKLSGLKSLIDSIKSKTVTITSWFKKITSGGSTRNDSNGFNEVNGTAHSNGTTGRAYKKGDWGVKKTETALTGELGQELVVYGNRYWTVGDNGAEFATIPKGAIVFNHKQTEELFANGKVTSGGGRGKIYANGSAFAQGTAFSGGIEPEVNSHSVGSKSPSSSSSSSSPSSSSSSSSDKKEETKETFDWVEIAISRIERAIDQLDQKANNVYKSWSSRNSALTKQISEVGDEIDLQQQAYDRYMKAANGVGLSSDWVNKIKNGKIDIETITDESLKEKIDEYQNYYEKALACQDAVEELKETEASLYAQRFENVQSQYDGILQGYEHTESMLNEYISQAEAKGHIVSKEYYNALIANEKQNISTLKAEQSALIAERDKAVADGKIEKYSEEWYNMCAEIDGVTQAIEEGNTALIEYNNSIRDIDWEVFDLIQERISDVTSESEFLIESMSNKDLYDDKGNLTAQGAATMGLHALNYNTHMYESDEYGKEIAELDKQIAKDPYDKELVNRRRELVEAQRESILAAEQEKQSIKDLVEDGISKELDALQELIDKKNEELESEKD